MKSIAYILSNDSDVTTLLADGADSVQTLFQEQEGSLPYLVVMEMAAEETYETFSGASTVDDVQFSVFVVSKTEHGTNGAKTILDQVRRTLEAVGRGSYGGEIIKQIRYTGEYSAGMFQAGRGNIVEAEMGFMCFRERTVTVPTPISVFTYSNNPQVAAGAITPMAASVTGDVLAYRIADSDLTNFTASGLSLNQSTGEITGTRLADASFEVLAEGKDGTIGAERVVVTAASTFATVENSDVSFQQTIPTGDTLVLDDYTIAFVDLNDTPISSSTYPSIKDGTFIVGTVGSCPTTFTFGLFVNGTSYGNVTVDVLDDLNITT